MHTISVVFFLFQRKQPDFPSHRKLVNRTVLFFAVIPIFLGCHRNIKGMQRISSSELLIAAAPALQGTLEKLIEQYTARYPMVVVQVRYGPSGALVTQIQEGAPCDVFMAADVASCENLIQKGFAKGPVIVYAQGRLSLAGYGLVPFLPMGGRITTEEDFRAFFTTLLTSSGLKKITIANPAVSPYGRVSVAVLQKMGVIVRDGTLEFSGTPLAITVIMAGSISQVRQYIVEGSVDMGFIHYSGIRNSSDFSPILAQDQIPTTSGIPWVLVPSDLCPPIDQGMVLLSHKEAAFQWRNYLMSAAAKNVLKEGGYSVP
ncbi:MAG: molybdate ABC transporter substrate-binding protein [Treponemataceae bacterium]|nr:molybdate ABC transporter substrate-binding protein [Treponemataceae bacterium]